MIETSVMKELSQSFCLLSKNLILNDLQKAEVVLGGGAPRKIFWKFATFTRKHLIWRFVVSFLILKRNTGRSSHSEVFLRKGVLKICSRFTEEHPCRSVISIKMQGNFIEIALWHGCSPVNLLDISRTPFRRYYSGWLFPHRHSFFLWNLQVLRTLFFNSFSKNEF